MLFVLYEFFVYLVVCVMVISFWNLNFIEVLYWFYIEMREGEKWYFVWVDGEYLWYYILVYDEENSDISKFMVFFEQMKRNFGLYCYLL